jgi:hypothetical protein
MRPRVLTTFAVILACAAGAAAAQPREAGARKAQAGAPAPAIRVFDLRTLERLGEAIWRQDSAAWVATDALRARHPEALGTVRGWLVDEAGAHPRVRFLREGAGGPEVAFDVVVQGRERTEVSAPADRRLSAEELAAFTARRSAAAAVGPVCRAGYNTAVVKDPDGDGWLVWLLAPSPAAGVVPLGGHYRFTLSADGRTVERRDALSASCMTLAAGAAPPKGATLAGLAVGHVVSPTPVETHVFLSRMYRVPLFVSAGGRAWKVDGGRIGEMRGGGR